MSTFEQLQEVMAPALNISADAITPASTQANLPAWDSLGHVNLMVALEDAFGIELQIEDFSKLGSVRAILEYLKSQGVE
jgi:acyl carrier protein